MGWLWSSGMPPSPLPEGQTSASPAETVPVPPEHVPPPAETRPLTRDELAERDLEAFLSEFRADVHPSSTKYQRVPKQPPPAPTHGTSSLPSSSSESLNLADSLLPTTMSCRAAFDAAFYCQSMGGQFNNLYRYGGIKNCSEHWSNFWFCMRSKSHAGEQKEDMIRDHYKKRVAKYKVGPSSEDVWESRKERLEWGEAFREDVDETVFPRGGRKDEGGE